MALQTAVPLRPCARAFGIPPGDTASGAVAAEAHWRSDENAGLRHAGEAVPQSQQTVQSTPECRLLVQAAPCGPPCPRPPYPCAPAVRFFSHTDLHPLSLPTRLLMPRAFEWVQWLLGGGAAKRGKSTKGSTSNFAWLTC